MKKELKFEIIQMYHYLWIIDVFTENREQLTDNGSETDIAYIIFTHTGGLTFAWHKINENLESWCNIPTENQIMEEFHKQYPKYYHFGKQI